MLNIPHFNDSKVNIDLNKPIQPPTPKPNPEDLKGTPISRARAKYDKENTVKITLKLNKKTDKAIIDKLMSVPNKQGFIRDILHQVLD